MFTDSHRLAQLTGDKYERCPISSCRDQLSEPHQVNSHDEVTNRFGLPEKTLNTNYSMVWCIYSEKTGSYI